MASNASYGGRENGGFPMEFCIELPCPRGRGRGDRHYVVSKTKAFVWNVGRAAVSKQSQHRFRVRIRKCIICRVFLR